MATSSEYLWNSPTGIKSDLPNEVVPVRLAHVFDESPPALKPLMPKLLPLRSVTLVKLEKMQQDIEEAMKAHKLASPNQ
ncbi:hypothetical protein RvY_05208 [Ramazzottius varieornatus]|uniref:BBSome-interacting protein 1 n=1 Tax=Ramazzottius varieornatus TaxID=947166 RepID=A0A1D1UZY1_RAMVA|nr:hypothetical protein RvY_05208 [Ramazzottius varieornatus]